SSRQRRPELIAGKLTVSWSHCAACIACYPAPNICSSKAIRSRWVVTLGLCLTFLCPAFGCDLDNMIGWTLIARKTVAGRIDKGVREDDFEGCDFDRIIVFDDNTGVRCTSYSYTYSYRPTAYIWANGSSLKLWVEDTEFDVSRR